MEIDESIPISNCSGFFALRSLADGPDPANGLIRLDPNRIYTVGREKRHSDIVIGDRSISRRHCQMFLDGTDRKIRLIDGCFPVSDRSRARVSLNGVFINGRKLQRGRVAELFPGDEILFGCGTRFGNSRCRIRYGFVVERILFSDADKSVFNEEIVSKASILLRRCRSILGSADPISYLRSPLGELDCDDDWGKTDAHEVKVKSANLAATEANIDVVVIDSQNSGHVDVADADDGVHLPSNLDKDTEFSRCYSDGKTFFLNRLQFMGPHRPDHSTGVTLPELLHPVKSLVRAFIATFTSDVAWFLSYCQLPNHLPITIACHNAERCWSASRDSRTSTPFSNYPKLVLVYPPFPEVIAFGKDRKKKGVACHHPKLIVLQRKDSVRIVVTSANLVSKQWNNVTNTVWWQDFPRRKTSDYSAFFCTIEDPKPDFAAHLAGFIASLVIDVPSQSYWIMELAKYDFGDAACHLVASIPGMHVRNYCYTKTYHFLTDKQTMHMESADMKFLGSVQASVVGLSHRFHTSSDCNGAQLKNLASLLGIYQGKGQTLEIIMKRNFNIAADANAVSIFVADSDDFSCGDGVQLGFLPRDVAKWVSPLSDVGFFSFSAFIYPKETLEAMLSGSNTKVPLLLNVSKGPKFSELASLMQSEYIAPMCSLLASMQRCLGIWRLQEVLSQYKWPELLETDFIYGSSSIGTSVNPQFIASFTSATGKRSCQLSDSEESDPEWGCWTTGQELQNPSIRILFPTIDRVKNGSLGIHASRRLISLSEKTWQGLRPARVFQDAVPHPGDRLGYPMHVKVARRRFQSKNTGSLPFGWIYCGSHNFSPAAWGQITSPSFEANVLGSSRLRICNYELGVVLVVPPWDAPNRADGNRKSLDDIPLPFLMPAPRYEPNDRPATALAMREALAEAAAVLQREVSLMGAANEEMDVDIPEEEEEEEEEKEMIEVSDYHQVEEKEEEKIYAEMLWSQVDSSES